MDSEYLAALQAGFEDELSKIAASAEERLREAQQEAVLEPAWQRFVNTKTPGHKIRETLSTIGGGVTGAGLGAGVGALAGMGLRGLGYPVTPSGGALTGGAIGAVFGLDAGGVLGDSHGQSDVNLGREYERYAKLEDKVLGGDAPSALHGQRRKHNP